MGSSYMGFDQISESDFDELDHLFHEFLPDREIWLFGTGNYAMSFFRFLKECGVETEGFVVTDADRFSDGFMGKQVISRAEFRRHYEAVHSKDKIGMLLTVKSSYYGELYPALMYLKEDLYIPKESYLRYAQEHCGEIYGGVELCFPIIDYCQGIACYGCTAGAPIAKKKIYELAEFEKDNVELYKLLGRENVKGINFTGGDVFLHPHLAELTELIRSLYPDIPISFSINGIGLDKQKDGLWRRLGKCDVHLNWTLYPICYPDYEEVFEKIGKLGNGGLHFLVQGDSVGESKSSWYIPFDRERKSKKYDWLFCRLHKCNHNLLIARDGTLRTCFAVRLFDNLRSRFGDEISGAFYDAGSSRNNYKIISELRSVEEIFDFMQKRIPLCDHCAIRKRHSLGKWEQSRGEVTEWLCK
ncbi:MAG: radical SAM protein [Lachnospiraceae bacterium]|nr:radical SAM protein [Lachnospiraceae bacterium]